MEIEPAFFQITFYIVSPVLTWLAVVTAYLAIYNQSKPSVIVHYEPSNNTGTVIDLIISNYGGGAARDIKFSDPIPLHCWGTSAPNEINKELFLDIKIPILAPGSNLRFQAGQYGGLLSQIGEGLSITVSYKFRTPLRKMKTGEDFSFLDVKYMASMGVGNSAAHDLSDAMKGRNNTVFVKTNRSLDSISRSLAELVSTLRNEKDKKE